MSEKESIKAIESHSCTKLIAELVVFAIVTHMCLQVLGDFLQVVRVVALED